MADDVSGIVARLSDVFGGDAIPAQQVADGELEVQPAHVVQVPDRPRQLREPFPPFRLGLPPSPELPVSQPPHHSQNRQRDVPVRDGLPPRRGKDRDGDQAANDSEKPAVTAPGQSDPMDPAWDHPPMPVLVVGFRPIVRHHRSPLRARPRSARGSQMVIKSTTLGHSRLLPSAHRARCPHQVTTRGCTAVSGASVCVHRRPRPEQDRILVRLASGTPAHNSVGPSKPSPGRAATPIDSARWAHAGHSHDR